jgi:hypothetical protein
MVAVPPMLGSAQRNYRILGHYLTPAAWGTHTDTASPAQAEERQPAATSRQHLGPWDPGRCLRTEAGYGQVTAAARDRVKSMKASPEDPRLRPGDFFASTSHTSLTCGPTRRNTQGNEQQANRTPSYRRHGCRFSVPLATKHPWQDAATHDGHPCSPRRATPQG